MEARFLIGWEVMTGKECEEAGMIHVKMDLNWRYQYALMFSLI